MADGFTICVLIYMSRKKNWKVTVDSEYLETWSLIEVYFHSILNWSLWLCVVKESVLLLLVVSEAISFHLVISYFAE